VGRSRFVVTILALGLAAAHDGTAQLVPPPAPPAAAVPSPDPAAWKIGPFEVAGMMDAYYLVGFNRPSKHVNGLRNFDDKAGQVELNMVSVTMDYSPKPVGFHLEAGAGHAFDIMGATEKDVTGMRYFKQAYINVKPASWKGLELDFGKFSSSASAEVIETPNNWNYSRSLLFASCTPYSHFGLRAGAPLGRHFNTSVQLVSGWNNIITGATFRTVGWTGSWSPIPGVTWTNTYYGGPDENKSNRGMRHLYDTILLLSTGSKMSLYVNFDYLHNSPKYTPGYRIYGIAGAARFALTPKLSLSPRLEWLNDTGGSVTGARQKAKEFTATARYTFRDRLSVWLEFRDDWSNRPFFNRGDQMAAGRRQPTILLGVVAIIAP
jgi:hypothetical protein